MQEAQVAGTTKKTWLDAFDERIAKQDSAYASQDNFLGIKRDETQDPFLQDRALNDRFSRDMLKSMGTIPVSSDKTKGFEGYEGGIYTDSEGHATGGYGHKLVPGVDYSGWTQKDWESQFDKDYSSKRKEIKSHFGDSWKGMPPEVQDVVTDLAFNMGTSGLTNKFPSLINDIREGNYASAAENLKYKDPYADELEKTDWWNQIGGDRYYEQNLANPLQNRGNYSYETLKRAGNRAGM